MGASTKSLAGTFAVLCLATWLGGCAVGSFDLGRGTTTASAPPSPAPTAEPVAEPNPGTYTPTPVQPSHNPPPQSPAQQQATQAASGQATSQPPTASQQTPQQLPAGRAARTPVIPEPVAEAESDVLTTQKAREQCWMASESTKFARNLDQKVKWVEKCVNDKMRTAGQ
jgi:hypothetical protein